MRTRSRSDLVGFALMLLFLGASHALATDTASAAQATFGKTSVGGSSDVFAPDRKRVNAYSLPVAGAVSRLSVYLAPTSSSGQQVLKGIVYADSKGVPGALLGTSSQLTFASSGTAGWYALPFPTALKLAAGRYWIGVITGASWGVAGFRYDSVSGARDYNANTYTSGPTSPFGSFTVDSEQMSLYATYTPKSPPSRPVNLSAPTISGTAQSGSQLIASPGSWSNAPTAYAYSWRRCDSLGANCATISDAPDASTYTLAGGDVGKTLRVSVIASNAAGSSSPAISAQTAVVTASSGVQHLEYIFEDGTVSVYDMDHSYKLVKTISLPQTNAGVRGVTVAPSTHMLFISYGPDWAEGGGMVLAYDLVANKVVWEVTLTTGIDSGQVSPDGKRLYMPTGENTPSGIWNILDTSNGAVIGTIQGGAAAHNTVVSNDGRYVYLGGHDYDYLDVYDTTTGKVREIGPLINGVRPFTVNGSNTLAFTTATEFDGFQVSDIITGKVLFTTSFGSVPPEFRFTGPSHGISLSPDEKQLYVIDSVNKEVRVYNVSEVSKGVAPALLGVIPVAGLIGTEELCAYDCGRGGWLQLSVDGRFVFVGDSGEVIETATRKVIATLSTLLNTKKSLEVDWSGGVPIATSERTGVGRVG